MTLRLLAPLLALSLALFGCSGDAEMDDASTPRPDAQGLDGGGDDEDGGGALCEANADCDDGTFCNGAERCDPGGSGADAQGCVPGPDACPGAACDEEGDACDTSCAEPDADGDGHEAIACGGDDCDDADANRFPENTEICDEAHHDEDCDASTYGARDIDEDDAFDAACCNVDAEGAMLCGSDCDDQRGDVRPGNVEACDTRDNDCDLAVDEEVTTTFYRDVDEDGYGDDAATEEACNPSEGYVVIGGDCDDDDAMRSPGSTELCEDEIDNNCNSMIDEAGARTFYADTDGDGFGDPAGAMASTVCEPPEGYATNARDCDDDNGAVFPEAVELCNGLDDDCSRGIAGGGVDTTEDADGDMHAPLTASCDGGYPRDDCNDSAATIYGGASELCDRRDNDCSSGGGAEVVEDNDSDGHAPLAAACEGGSLPKDDCRDNNGAVYPGADEVCDRVDSDCSNGGATETGEDFDNDGQAPTGAACAGGFARTDCNDTNATIFQGATELCDGLDNNCSSGGGAETAEDADGDDHAPGAAACTGGPFPKNDCVDGNATIYGGAPELCDRLDNDCSGGGGAELSEDMDGDGHAPIGGSCEGGPFPEDDCVDMNGSIYLGAPELCDRLDNDCSADGETDASEDVDNDGHAPLDATCSGGPRPIDDCVDTNATIYLGAPERCDRLDNDCSTGGGVETGEDFDGDGRAPVGHSCQMGPLPETDCVDTNATIYGSAPELCDRLDNNCSTGGGVEASEDADDDGFAATFASCSGGPLPRTDCVDGNDTIYPSAPELCDRLDNDCSTGGGSVAAEDQDDDLHAPLDATCSGGPRPRDDCDDYDALTYPGAGAPLPPRLIGPENGGYTGSLHAAGTRRPTFRWALRGDCAQAQTYDLEVDDSCAAGAYPSCTFASRELVVEDLATTSHRPAADLAVSAIAPVGTRYAWRVTACVGATCSAPSMVRYVDVGRVFGDVNGDGYADVIVGADLADNPANNEGNVYVYFGAADGVPSAPSQTLDSPANQSNLYFGRSLAFAGDVNADGYGDVIVGAPGYDQGTGPIYYDVGRVYGYLGGAAGLPASPSTTYTGSTVGGSSPYTGTELGTAVAAAGDIDADGYADVVTTERLLNGFFPPSSYLNIGDAQVQRGTAGGFGAGSANTTTLGNPYQANAGFGNGGAGGRDVNGDGYSDVLVGSPTFDFTASSNEGAVVVYPGRALSGSSHINPGAFYVSASHPSGANLGSTLAVADVNGDGYQDVVAGAPGYDGGGADEGLACVFHGGPRSIENSAAYDADRCVADPTPEAGARFGASVALADVDGDGDADLIVGAPLRDDGAADEGVAFVFGASGSGIAASASASFGNPANQAEGQFGNAMASASDVDGDGYADVVVGAYLQDAGASDEGNVFLYEGGASGLVTATPWSSLDSPANQASAQFGRAVH